MLKAFAHKGTTPSEGTVFTRKWTCFYQSLAGYHDLWLKSGHNVQTDQGDREDFRGISSFNYK